MNISSPISTTFSKQILLASSMLAISAAAFAGLKAPESTSGLSAEVAHLNSLEAQVPKMIGYQLRGRKITIEPGGGTAEHSHAESPGIVIVVSGEITEVRNGKKSVYQTGETWIEKSDTNHWVLNESNSPTVIWMVDLPPQE